MGTDIFVSKSGLQIFLTSGISYMLRILVLKDTGNYRIRTISQLFIGSIPHCKHKCLRIIIVIQPSPIGFIKIAKYIFCNHSLFFCHFFQSCTTSTLKEHIILFLQVYRYRYIDRYSQKCLLMSVVILVVRNSISFCTDANNKQIWWLLYFWACGNVTLFYYKYCVYGSGVAIQLV